MAKVLQSYNLLNVTMNKFGILHTNLSVDEYMVPYFDRLFAYCLSPLSQLDFASNVVSSVLRRVYLIMFRSTKAKKMVLIMNH